MNKLLSISIVVFFMNVYGMQKKASTFFQIIPKELRQELSTHVGYKEVIDILESSKTYDEAFKKIKGLSERKDLISLFGDSNFTQFIIDELRRKLAEAPIPPVTEPEKHEIAQQLGTFGAQKWLKQRLQQQNLLSATEKGKIEVVKALLDQEVNANASDEDNNSALILAPTKELADLLLSRGANIHARNNSGKTALMSAAYWNHKDIVKVLLAAGADVNAQDRGGDTALMLLVQKWMMGLKADTEIINLLLSHGADIHAKDKRGETVLTMAKNARRKDIVDFLEKKSRELGK